MFPKSSRRDGGTTVTPASCRQFVIYEKLRDLRVLRGEFAAHAIGLTRAAALLFGRDARAGSYMYRTSGCSWNFWVRNQFLPHLILILTVSPSMSIRM